MGVKSKFLDTPASARAAEILSTDMLRNLDLTPSGPGQSAAPRASRHLARMTMQATRQIMTLGRYTANVERNVLISSALFIDRDVVFAA